MRPTLILLLCLMLSGGVIYAQGSSELSGDYFPPSREDGGWRKNTDPAFIRSLGMSPEKLEAFGRWNVEKNWGGRSLMHKSCIVIKDGWIVGEWYADKEGNLLSVSGNKDRKARLASNGKSVAMALFGIVEKERGKGQVPADFSLQSRVYDRRWLPEGFPLSDPRKQEITFDLLFMHKSGILPEAAPAEDRGGDKNSASFILGHQPENPESAALYFDPGHPEQYFPLSSYSTVGFRHLIYVLKNLYHQPTDKLLEEKLFHPIGIYDIGYYPEIEPGYANWLDHGVRWVTSGGLYLTPRDYARFAWFLMHDGVWKGRQLSEKGWIKHFASSAEYPNICGNVPGTWTSGQTQQVGSRGYFPAYPSDMFRLSGSGLNKAYIIPSLDLIVIRTSRIYPSELWNEQEDVFLGKLFGMFTPAEQKDTQAGKKISAGPLPGQVIADPLHPGKMVRNQTNNNNGTLKPFFLCGPGDPEGFLYRGKRNPDGTREGDQEDLIARLIREGGNSIYSIAVRTNGGDAWKSKRDDPETWPDDLHNPWINQDPKQGLNEAILDQWEEWFELMDRHNIINYFFIYDDAIDVAKEFGWSLDKNGELQPDEKRFIQGLVNRFKHHKNLIWCVMEEGQEIGKNWKQHISKIAEAIREADEYQHIIASHQLPGNVFYHSDDPNINQFAIQTDKHMVGTTDSLHCWLVNIALEAQERYSLVMSEDYVQGNISVPAGDREEIRQRNWASAMAGAYVMVLGMDIAHTPEAWLNDCRILQEFFEGSYFNRMHSADDLASHQACYVLADNGYDYILYSSKASHRLGIKDLPEGTYTLKWLDCTNGKSVALSNRKIPKGNRSWKIPKGFGSEVALSIHRTSQRPAEKETLHLEKKRMEKDPVNKPPKAQELSAETDQNKKVYIQLGFDDPDGGPGPYTILIVSGPKHGTLTGSGNDRFYTPEKGYTGEDRIIWKVSDGQDNSEEAEIRIRIK